MILVSMAYSLFGPSGRFAGSAGFALDELLHRQQARVAVERDSSGRPPRSARSLLRKSRVASGVKRAACVAAAAWLAAPPPRRGNGWPSNRLAEGSAHRLPPGLWAAGKARRARRDGQGSGRSRGRRAKRLPRPGRRALLRQHEGREGGPDAMSSGLIGDGRGGLRCRWRRAPSPAPRACGGANRSFPCRSPDLQAGAPMSLSHKAPAEKRR